MSQSTVLDGSVVVFDLDGTLVDSAADLVATLNRVLAQEGLPQIEASAIGSLVGHGAIKMLERAFQHLEMPLDDTFKMRLHKLFLEDYQNHLADLTRPFDGVIDTLETLKFEGWILSVCTNKYEGMSKKLLKTLEMDHYFTAICGSDTYPVRKPDPKHLTATIEDSGGAVRRAIMVGDSITDVETAKAANIPVIGVTFGYSQTPMDALGPTQIITHYRDMKGAIDRIASAFI